MSKTVLLPVLFYRVIEVDSMTSFCIFKWSPLHIFLVSAFNEFYE